MQIYGVSNNFYQVFTPSVTSQSEPSVGIANISMRKSEVTLSSEAMAEFETLAVYTEQAGEYLPKINILNNTDFHKIGYGAWAEGWQNTYQAELSEYDSEFKAYYEETKIEHGILTAAEHYEKFISLKGSNIEFQQTFEGKLSRDPGMLQLMDTLGIKKPA